MNSPAAILSDPALNYPGSSPFSPDIRYPEYPFEELDSEHNYVYENIRQLFHQLDFDKEHYGLRSWNPLGKFIKPGSFVVIKPNWVNHVNPIEIHISALISHSSLIRVILDYVLIALNGSGQVIIGDAPIQSCDFDALIRKSKIDEVVSFLKKRTSTSIEIIDFRKEKMISKHGTYKRIENLNNKHIAVNLKHTSYLNEIKNEYNKFRVTSYDKRKMFKHHNDSDHIYLISEEVLQADTIIEIPKVKSHRKAGMTCCIKNNVGINTVKDCLVHHRKGSLKEGGDAYKEKNIGLQIKELLNEGYDRADNIFLQLIYKVIFKLHKFAFPNVSNQSFSEGNWYGNDTVWRMILDLNKIVFYADKGGAISDRQQRNVLHLVDGIIGGEGEGPLKPRSIHSGILAFGIDPLLLDSCIASLIGFDYCKMPSIKNALINELFGYGLDQLSHKNVLLNGSITEIGKISEIKKFEPSSGWKNHIEKIK
jgi:uncharacterized protein (DUF362 family)